MVMMERKNVTGEIVDTLHDLLCIAVYKITIRHHRLEYITIEDDNILSFGCLSGND